jgi:hypothetical protein
MVVVVSQGHVDYNVWLPLIPIVASQDGILEMVHVVIFVLEDRDNCEALLYTYRLHKSH